MPTADPWRASWGVTEMGQPGSAALDSRPVFRVADFGLGQRLLQLAEAVLRHARGNRYRFEFAARREPGQYEVALVDMTTQGAATVVDALRAMSARCPAILRIGRRHDAVRGHDDLLVAHFTAQLLEALNRAVESRMLPGAEASARRPLASSAGESATGPRERPPAAAAEARSGPGETQAPSARRPRVLVVDDSPTVRRQLAVALHRMGLDSEGVNSAREALETLAVRRYELVFVDVMMPEIDGYRLTREIKRNRILKPMPVVILTSRSSPFDLARGALAGCDSYLVKPVSMQALRETVARHLQRGPGAAA
jgi:CheY-like chemotaxis protein